MSSHHCPRCGFDAECVDLPEDCWLGEHGCRECGLSFPEDPVMLRVLVERMGLTR